MKKLFNAIIIFTTALTVLTSCENVLDKKSPDSYPQEKILNTEDGINALLEGCYTRVMSRYYYGFFMQTYEAAKGPDFFQRNATGGTSYQYDAQYSTSSTSNGISKYAWRDIYSLIRNLTLLIENIDNIPGEINNLRRIKGEAYAMRGLAYFDLMRIFAFPPKFSCSWGTNYNENLRLGLPIVTDPETGSKEEDYYIGRATADSTFQYIEEQFEKAIPLLADKTSSKGHINEATAIALYMRVKLYEEKYDDVIVLGEDWMQRFGSQYSLLTYDSYTTNYYKVFNSESIWELAYSTTNNLSSNSLNFWARKPTIDNPDSEDDGSVTGNIGYAKLCFQWGHANRGKDFLEYYTKDVRQYIICKLDINEHPEYYGCRKYVGDPYHYIHNIPVVRLPEIYLTLAEAYYNTGENDIATEYVSRVSLARRDAATTVTRLSNILDERRREFMLEGHTYWDMFRTGTNITNRQIVEYNDDSSISFGSVSSPHYRAVPPIPLSEMNANPAIRDQQNPGYADWVLAIEEDD
ncbi:MAG: RagB/SusD family nutrient uptake outer membrane protein [Bacteroidales bacterium]|nr:RagB/SusD family nutrient uptake outer membrane protein [Bacteroidales bacterium]MDD2424785.1 RagB/SusD family nutrient uptake outer membrane protein [Bacteroidales bacterium]MDD3989689.1 RagB/SusD family nutrient uptake outer membrane protein [Bacteroidales bacterium]MDD4638197.1 RagB/SusD family nutrient uptake outer membrane protein [Bacteroidales bacterium]